MLMRAAPGRASGVREISFHERYCELRARIEEIPTPGLRPSIYPRGGPGKPEPLQWEISGTECWFSEHQLESGSPYVSWSLYFHLDLIQGLMGLARAWPDDLGPVDRYQIARKYVEDVAREQCKPVFCDARETRESGDGQSV